MKQRSDYKTIIVAYSPDHASKIKRLLNKLSGKKVVVALNENARRSLTEEGIPHKTPDDYFLGNKKQSEIIKKSLKWLQTWPSKKIRDNKSFKEILTYENTSLWWFGRSTYLYENYKTVATYIERINRILDAEKPDKVVVPDKFLPVNDGNLPGKISIFLCELKDVSTLCQKSRMKDYMKYHLRGLLQLIIPFLLIMVRFIRSARAKIKYFGCWHEKEKFGMSKRNKILILCHTGGIQEVIDPITKRHSKSNVMVKDVIKELKKNLNNEVIAVQGHYKDRSVPEMDPPYIFFDNYINLSIYLKTLREALSLIKKWQKLKNNKNFKYSLKYKNIPLWELLNYKFSNLFSADLVLAILTIETVKRIINIEKPDAIVMTYETGYYGKAAIIEGKRRGIPTLGMQHGIIHPYHPDYMYGEEEVSNDGVISPLYCPFPDKLAVYGEYVKNVLTKYSAYPQDRIVITGQPRYDILAEIEKFSDKKNTCKRLNLDQNKKNIVLATQGFQSKYGLPDYDKTLFNAVFNALKDFSETQLIIKLHPKEDGELQRKMVSERGLKNVIITKGELYEILYICDILITFTSTVAIEALILDKTVIIVNLAGVPDPMPYVESGAAIGIYKEEDLAIAIRKALYDKETKEELRRARKKFVYEHTYRQDGRATERVADLIIQMIEESKRRKE